MLALFEAFAEKFSFTIESVFIVDRPDLGDPDRMSALSEPPAEKVPFKIIMSVTEEEEP
jgi:hypothetical protein